MIPDNILTFEVLFLSYQFFLLTGCLSLSASYKLKFNQKSSVEVNHLLETAKACNFVSVLTVFFVISVVFVIFRTIVRLFIFVGCSRNPNFF